MEDADDRELYMKLAKGAGSSASLTAYIKRVLEEYMNISMEIAERQSFHDQILMLIREEMQSQGMKLVGALLAGIGTVNVPAAQEEVETKETGLPDTCEKLPDELRGVLDFIS